VAFLKIDSDWEFSNTTGTFIDADTTKFFNIDPQPPKKLHSLTCNVYAYPELNRAFGMTIREEAADGSLDNAERKVWRRVMFGLDPPTTNDVDLHTRPPDPEEAVRSTIKLSQGPISLGIDITTTGDRRTEGPRMEIDWRSFEDHLVQEGSTWEVHRAFNTPPFRTNASPTSITGPRDEISRDKSLVHTQSDEEGSWAGEEVEERINSNSNPHGAAFDTPPLLVGEVKITVILLPSDENSDRRVEGGVSTSSAPRTTKRSPAGKISLYAGLDGPLSVTFNLYAPETTGR
jgi:hypothetical protein